jgi:hypothetical protein
MNDTKKPLDWEGFKNMASDWFEKQGELMPMWVGRKVTKESFLIATPWQGEDDKIVMLEMLRNKFKELDVVEYYMCSEVWMRTMSLEERAASNLQIKDYEDKEERLMFLRISRDEQEYGFRPIIRTSTEVTLGPWEVMPPDMGGGRMAELLD